MDPQDVRQSISPVSSKLVGKFVDDREDNDFIVDNFEWRYLYEPNIRDNVKFDLNHKFETFKHDPFYDGKINPLLKYITKAPKAGTNLRDAVYGCDLVTNRGTLVKIATYSSLKFWQPKLQNEQQSGDGSKKLYAQLIFCKFNDVIFAYERTSDEKRLEQENESDWQKKATYWGHKFEQYMTTEHPNGKPNIEESVSTLSPQYGVFKAQVSGSNGRKVAFLINAEMDCLNKNGDFVELKTAKHLVPKNPRHKPEPNWYFNNKSKWWFQSILTSVERIVVGMRNQDGVVVNVKEINVRTVDRSPKEWKTEECLNSLLKFYDDVRSMLDTKPEGNLLKVELIESNNKEIIKTWVDESERRNYEFLLPEFLQRYSS